VEIFWGGNPTKPLIVIFQYQKNNIGRFEGIVRKKMSGKKYHFLENKKCSFLKSVEAAGESAAKSWLKSQYSA